ncbi:DUF5776 domain-containing protein [Weissella confusa]|uniref:DUF5776 domain-containing protein n=1 Tax=Weissella confusa TaxID=1583 RepID=UPI0035A27F25
MTENYRESYPETINPNVIVLNLWHGVGLKHVELGLDEKVDVADNIVRKWARNYSLFKNNVKFLTTSEAMESHFKSDMKLSNDQVVRGPYPRNVVYSLMESSLEKKLKVSGYDLDSYNDVYAFVPTYRSFSNSQGEFKKLIPNLAEVVSKMEKTDSLFIVKLHPQMQSDESFLAAKEEYSENKNILFWQDEDDMYEIMHRITVGVVDYSSIFYDLLEAGVSKFIRFIPDYKEYVTERELIGDYFDLTDGTVAYTFERLLELFSTGVENIERKDYLMDYFFGFEATNTLNDLIKSVDNSKPSNISYPELHTFDIFDTLIKRNTLHPHSIFALVQKNMLSSNLKFESYLTENYPKIRNQVEFDLRDSFRKTTYERNTDKIEVTLDEILDRLKNNYSLTNEQVAFLYDQETQAEVKAVEPISFRIEELFELLGAGNDVMLVSDMYLPETVIKDMLNAADSRLSELPLYLSSKVGYQKSTGRLFRHIFFSTDYHYSKWVHHGDNKHADGVVPRKLGITTINHDMDSYLENEKWFVDKANWTFKYDAYRLATLFQRRRWELMSGEEMTFDESAYYAYSFIGPTLVPYVNWALRDAINRGYQTVYFISRDGYYLKQIADVLIAKQNLTISAKFIYGSRKAWRVASFINEVDPASFTPFGMFSSMDGFDDLVKSSQLPEDELLQMLPELEGYRNEPTLKGDIAIGIREIFENSEEYKARLLEIAAERREIVREYLKQEIDFDENFAFVEFWGRGYTQDTLTRLLIDAAGREVDNPFYYVRNFTNDIGHSIRHRYTTMPANFSDFESIFATTPYKSIPGYEYSEDGSVKPVFIPQWNEFHSTISKNIQKFASDYADLHVEDAQRFDRFVGETEYDYYFNHPEDQFITSVFANYKDNVAMYDQVQEFAPELDAETVLNTPIADLKKMTKNLDISLSRSSDEAREAFELRKKVENINLKPAKKSVRDFPVNDLENYLVPTKFPVEVVLLADQPTYASVKWTENSKSKVQLSKFTILTVTGIDWSERGVPRLRTELGYITANKRFVTTMRDDIDQYLYKDVANVVVTASSYYYKSLSFDRSQRTENKTKRGQKIAVQSVEWTNNGTPRLLTAAGYLTANKNFVSNDAKLTALRKKAVRGIVKRLTK